jgi:hypothetical protein
LSESVGDGRDPKPGAGGSKRDRRASERRKLRSVDMQFQFRACDTRKPLAAPRRLAEHRDRLFALIREYRQTVERQRGLNAAIRILREILPCSGAYFAMTESPYCDEHRRLLEDIRQTLDRCSTPGTKPMAAELSHALDGLVLHEAAIRLRTSSHLP